MTLEALTMAYTGLSFSKARLAADRDYLSSSRKLDDDFGVNGTRGYLLDLALEDIARANFHLRPPK
jgi:hypothetical protein